MLSDPPQVCGTMDRRCGRRSYLISFYQQQESVTDRMGDREDTAKKWRSREIKNKVKAEAPQELSVEIQSNKIKPPEVGSGNEELNRNKRDFVKEPERQKQIVLKEKSNNWRR